MCGTLLDARIIGKTRKLHRCFGCGRIIPKGTRADKATSAEHGEISTSYLCLDCTEFSQTKSGREAVDSDGCLWPDAFGEEEYARFPILIPVEQLWHGIVRAEDGE